MIQTPTWAVCGGCGKRVALTSTGAMRPHAVPIEQRKRAGYERCPWVLAHGAVHQGRPPSDDATDTLCDDAGRRA